VCGDESIAKMTDDLMPSRRRFLEFTGVGVGTAVAGCTELSEEGTPTADDQSEPTEQTGTTGDGSGGSGSGDGSRRVSVAVEPDQQALQETRSDIQQRLQEEEINQTEAQQEFAAAQQELVAEAVADVETAVEEAGATVEDALEAQGLLLVAGPADGLIDLLDAEATGGLLSADVFEQVRSQQGQQS